MRYFQLGEQFVINLDKVQFVSMDDKRVRIYMHDFAVVFTTDYEFGAPYDVQIEVTNNALEIIKEELTKVLNPYYVSY